jgi:hypothetical protein
MLTASAPLEKRALFAAKQSICIALRPDSSSAVLKTHCNYVRSRALQSYHLQHAVHTFCDAFSVHCYSSAQGSALQALKSNSSVCLLIEARLHTGTARHRQCIADADYSECLTIEVFREDMPPAVGY